MEANQEHGLGKPFRFYLLIIAIFFTIISQTPFIWKLNGLPTQLLIMPFWIVLAFISLFTHLKFDRKQAKMLLPLGLIVIAFLLFELLTGKAYVTSGLSQQIYMALIVSLVGYANADMIKKEWKVLVWCFLLTSVFVATDVYLQYFRGYDFSRIEYVYRAKNSAASIFLSATLLATTLWRRKKWLMNGMLVLASAFLLYLCVMMRSRAVLLAIVFLPFIFIWWGGKGFGQKVMKSFLVLMAAAGFLMIPPVYNLLVRNILLKATDGASVNVDLNYISSNRFDYFKTFAREINGHEILGLGYYYMDNFYLEAILHYGYVLGIAVIALALVPMFVSLFQKTTGQPLRTMFIALAFTYTLNAAFEGYAPFGPGAKSFILWLVCGCVLNTMVWKEKE